MILKIKTENNQRIVECDEFSFGKKHSDERKMQENHISVVAKKHDTDSVKLMLIDVELKNLDVILMNSKGNTVDRYSWNGNGLMTAGSF